MARKKGKGDRERSDEVEGSPIGVGYGRPPVETRFKPGQSGNPKGRPRRVPTVHEALDKLLAESIQVREGERVRKVTKRDALIGSLLNRALKGDNAAARVILKILSAPPPQDSGGLAIEAGLTADDDGILEDFCARLIEEKHSVEESIQDKINKLADGSRRKS